MTECSCRVIVGDGSHSLIQAITDLCAGAESASFAVGYLFLEGLADLVPCLHRLKRTQLLIGNVVNRLTEEQIREEHGARSGAGQILDVDNDMFAGAFREQRDRAAVETALNLRRTIDSLPRTDANRSLIVELAQLIATRRLQVRLLTSHRLHAKLALISYPTGHPCSPGTAIVGSTNVTMPIADMRLSGANRAPSDLDFQIGGAENFNLLSGWFGLHWAEAQDFQKELFEELGLTWALSLPI